MVYMDPKNNEAMKAENGRKYEIDAVKTLAIIFMVIVHSYEYLSTIDFLSVMPSDAFRNIVEFMGGPLAAPVFMFAMGMSMVYTTHNQPLDFVKRGVNLLIGGFALNFFKLTGLSMIADAMGIENGTVFSTFESIFIVDILHFAGLAFILTGLLKFIRLRSCMIFGLSLAMLGVCLLTSRIIDPCTLKSMILGFFIFTGKTCAFSLLSWYVYPAAGLLFAEIMQKYEDKPQYYKKVLAGSVIFLVLITAVLVWTGYDIRSIYTLAHDSYYSHDYIHFIFILSTVLIELSLAFFVFRGVKDSALGRFIEYCSVNLSKIYVIQWLLVSATITVIVLFDLSFASPVGVIPAGLAIGAAAIGLSLPLNLLMKKVKSLRIS